MSVLRKKGSYHLVEMDVGQGGINSLKALVTRLDRVDSKELRSEQMSAMKQSSIDYVKMGSLSDTERDLAG